MATDGRQEQAGTITIDAASLGLKERATLFALRVKGDSMTGALIGSNDLVILEDRAPRENDIVAALIDGETTLKRLVMNKEKPCLKSENPRYPDLVPVCELKIQGVMVGLIRAGQTAPARRGRPPKR